MYPNRDSIYVECSCLTSRDEYFQNNKPDHFFVRLNKPLNLAVAGSWKVGLCEIDFVMKKKNDEKNGKDDDDDDGDDGADDNTDDNADVMKNTKKKVKTTKTTPHHYEVVFSACNGMYVRGKQTRSLRTVPYSINNKHRMFHTVYYMPVETSYIETFEIRVNTVSTDEKYITLDESLFTLISCTLHFKRVK